MNSIPNAFADRPNFLNCPSRYKLHSLPHIIHHRKCIIQFSPLFLCFFSPRRCLPLSTQSRIFFSCQFAPFFPSKGAVVFAVTSLPILSRPLLTFLDVRGFDITGVTTEIDLTFPEIRDECDCIRACLGNKTICNNYVWKFSTPTSVSSGYRTCTLCTTPTPRHVRLTTSRLQL